LPLGVKVCPRNKKWASYALFIVCTNVNIVHNNSTNEPTHVLCGAFKIKARIDWKFNFYNIGPQKKERVVT
jgi:hypothetical protein